MGSCNLTPNPYISTLDPPYHMSIVGMKLIELIQKYQPKICLEMHCYHPEKKDKLIIKVQNDILGVPELVELEWMRAMIGSISSLARSVFFVINDFLFILKMPCRR
ncbi:MAG TPA: DUF2119 family protein [Corynebacteriales bacterium]|nr:DUF2119 family protein [Mycobacteriales bacterium]